MNLINPQYRFSLYNNLFSVSTPDGEMDINQLIEVVKYGYIKGEINLLRNSTGELYNTQKKQLPAVTLSGTFSKRNAEGIVKHSGLIQVDIDDVTNYDPLFQTICDDPYTYVCFRSPGGKGIKIVVKVKPTVTTHLEQFYALEKYYQELFNIRIDRSCKDISRCMLLSYDPTIYCNPFSKMYEEQYMPVVKRVSTDISTAPQKSTPANNILRVEAIIKATHAKKIDISGKYDVWIKIGYALCDAFGEDGRKYFHQLSSNYPNYTISETDKKYTNLLKNHNGITHLGTLIFIAKEHGIDV